MRDLLGDAKITLWRFLILIPVEKVPRLASIIEFFCLSTSRNLDDRATAGQAWFHRYLPQFVQSSRIPPGPWHRDWVGIAFHNVAAIAQDWVYEKVRPIDPSPQLVWTANVISPRHHDRAPTLHLEWPKCRFLIRSHPVWVRAKTHQEYFRGHMRLHHDGRTESARSGEMEAVAAQSNDMAKYLQPLDCWNV